MLKVPVCLLIMICLFSCSSNSHRFTTVFSDHSGIHFNNTIKENDSVNVLDFENVYNGGGVGVGDRVRVLTPDPYTEFQLTPLTPFDAQQIRFTAAVPPSTVSVRYFVDAQPTQTANTPPFGVWWALMPGSHLVSAEATLADGSIQKSEALPFSVSSYAAPDEKPHSGEQP